MKKLLNYEFALKDFDATKARHLNQIKALRKTPLAITTRSVWDKVIDSDWLEQIEYYLKTGGLGIGNLWHEFNVRREDGRLHDFHNHASQLREVKTAINTATRAYIVSQLEYNELPKSWDTAFYCLYYKRINAGMKRLAKYYI